MCSHIECDELHEQNRKKRIFEPDKKKNYSKTDGNEIEREKKTCLCITFGDKIVHKFSQTKRCVAVTTY